MLGKEVTHFVNVSFLTYSVQQQLLNRGQETLQPKSCCQHAAGAIAAAYMLHSADSKAVTAQIFETFTMQEGLSAIASLLLFNPGRNMATILH